MNNRTRNFMLGSAAVLVGGLSVGLVAYYGGLPGMAARHSGPEEFEYLPADTAIVAYADVAAVMHSDFRQRIRSVMPDDEKGKGRQRFEEATGIDVERDIDAVTVALVSGADDRIPLGLVRGRLDEGRIEALAREHGATVDLYQGVRVISRPARAREEVPADDEPRAGGADTPGRRDHGYPALAFVEPGLLLIGAPDAVRAAIDDKRSGRNILSNTDLLSRIARIEGQANAWAVGRLDSLPGRAELPQEIAVRLPAITWFEAAGHVNGGISGTLKAEARDEESARNLRDVINGLMALGRMQAPKSPPVQALMRSVNLGGSGRTVELSFSIPSELIEAVIPKARAKAVAAD